MNINRAYSRVRLPEMSRSWDDGSDAGSGTCADSVSIGSGSVWMDASRSERHSGFRDEESSSRSIQPWILTGGLGSQIDISQACLESWRILGTANQTSDKRRSMRVMIPTFAMHLSCFQKKARFIFSSVSSIAFRKIGDGDRQGVPE